MTEKALQQAIRSPQFVNIVPLSPTSAIATFDGLQIKYRMTIHIYNKSYQ